MTVRQKILPWISRLAIFLGAFLLPIGVALSTGMFKSSHEEQGEESKDAPVVFRGPSSYLRVVHSDSLNLTKSEDSVVFIWSKLTTLPANSGNNEREILLLKYDGAHPARPGFGLGFSRGSVPGTVRPEVYWKDTAGRGGWFAFPEAPYVPQVWTLYALSYREGKFLGLHTIVLPPGSEPETKLLGGYEVEDMGAPLNDAELLIGAPTTSALRGSIGAFGIIGGKHLSKGYHKLLKALGADPFLRPDNSLKDALPTDAVIHLWSVDGVHDLSQEVHPIFGVRVKATGGQGDKKQKKAKTPKEEGV